VNASTFEPIAGMRPATGSGFIGDSADLIGQVLAIANVGNIADAGLRIEINRRALKNGTTQLYWNWRKRGKAREFYAYGGTAETLSAQHPDRLARYRPRHHPGRIDGLSTIRGQFAEGD
jgi:hypothetical protein